MGNGSSLGPNDYEKRSKLAHARGVGSSYRGSHEWLMGRVLGILAIPFTVYVLISLILGAGASYYSLVEWLSNPFNATCLFIGMLTGAWHGMYGLITVVNDYIHHSGVNFIMTLFLRLFVSFSVVLSTISILITIF